MNLKEFLFLRTMKELDRYLYLSESPEMFYSEKEIEKQRCRFCSLYQLIEDAVLEDEYYAFKTQIEQGNCKNFQYGHVRPKDL